MENFFQEVIVGLPEIFIIFTGYFFIVSIIKFFKFLTENDPVKKKTKRDSLFEYFVMLIFTSSLFLLLSIQTKKLIVLLLASLTVVLCLLITTKIKKHYFYLASSMFIFTMSAIAILLIVAFIGGATVPQKIILGSIFLFLLFSRFTISKLY
jgi:hypothetical protein